MKIIYISYQNYKVHYGGELLLTIDRLSELSSRKNEAVYVTSPSNLPQSIEGLRLTEIIEMDNPYKGKINRLINRLIFPYWVILKILRKKPEIIHLGSIGGFDPMSNFLGSMAIIFVAKIINAKTLCVHSLADSEVDTFATRGLANQLRNLWLTQVDQIVSVSPALYEGVNTVFPTKSICIMNAVRDDLFTFPTPDSKKLYRSLFQTSDDDIVIIFLGSVTKRKGFDILTQSYFELSRNYPNLKLWVIGPKSKAENQNLVDSEVNLLINELTEKTSCIRFFGKIEDRTLLASILGSADIFVFPTRREGMPLAPGEAMACGLPVVISRIPGVTDVMNVEGETGYFCEPGNVVSLTNAIKKLVDNPQLRNRMGQNARSRIVENFGWKKHIDEWEALYKSLVDE